MKPKSHGKRHREKRLKRLARLERMLDDPIILCDRLRVVLARRLPRL